VEQSKCYRLYLNSGKIAFAAMYLRRVQVVGRRFEADAPLLTHDSTIFMPPAFAEIKNGVGLPAALPGADVCQNA
jgi:hypothetical protein